MSWVTAVPLLTACIWRLNEDTVWRASASIEPHPDGGALDDGVDWMLGQLTDKWTAANRSSCFRDVDVPGTDRTALDEIFKYQPLTPTLILRLNPHADVPWVMSEAALLGYPIAAM